VDPKKERAMKTMKKAKSSEPRVQVLEVEETLAGYTVTLAAPPMWRVASARVHADDADGDLIILGLKARRRDIFS
jgi:hypothetical protein